MVVSDGNGFEQIKRTGRVVNLEEALEEPHLEVIWALAHTLGDPRGCDEANAHPHTSSDGKISMVIMV